MKHERRIIETDLDQCYKHRKVPIYCDGTVGQELLAGPIEGRTALEQWRWVAPGKWRNAAGGKATSSIGKLFSAEAGV